MSNPTTMAEWVEHCQSQAEQWDEVGTEYATEQATAWRALGLLTNESRDFGWCGCCEQDHPETVAAVTRLAAGLERLVSVPLDHAAGGRGDSGGMRPDPGADTATLDR